MSNINWDFIKQLEGTKLNGYVPNASNSNSGVTIASGFDLGARSLSDLTGLPEDLVEKLKPYLGVKGAEAQEMAGNLEITNEQASIIDEFSKREAVSKLGSRWQNATGSSFDDLPEHQATVIASVAFQYGDLESRTPNFWRQVTTGDWDGAVANLNNFGDDYGTRRRKEAEFFQKKRLESTLARTAPADSELRGLSNEELVELAKEKMQSPTTGEEVVSPYSDVDVPDWFLGKKVDDTSEKAYPYLGSVEGEIPEEKVTLEQEPTDTKELIKKHIEENSTIAKALKSNEFGDANPMYFSENAEQIWSAAFRQRNPVVALRDLILDMTRDEVIEEGYDILNDPRVEDDPSLLWRALSSESSVETTRIIDNLYKERMDNDLLANSDSSVANLSAALATPSTAAPMGIMRYMSSGNILTRAGAGAAYHTAMVLPEEIILQAAREDRTIADSLWTLGLAGAIGAGTNSLFGPSVARIATRKQILRNAKMDEQFSDVYMSAGAAANPSRQRETAKATMHLDAAKETGVGLEKVPFNPVLRMLQSNNPIVRGLAAQMVDMGGVAQKKIDKEWAMSQSVETTFRTNYLSRLVESLREGDKAYLAYRGKQASENDVVRSFQVIGSQIADRFKSGQNWLSEVDFRVRIGKAMRRGDVDEVGDIASPFVTQAARSARKQFDFIKREAESVRLFETEIQKAISIARKSADEAKVAELQTMLNRVRSEGVSVNTAISYLPRIYRIDRIMKDPQRFVTIVRGWAMETKGMSRQAAQKYADEVFDSVTRSRPYIGLEADDLDQLLTPGSSKVRSFEIPDELIEEFLESDIEVLLRHQTRTMGMDIELSKRFGSIDMKNVIDNVVDEYEKLIDEATDIATKQKLRKNMQDDIRDIRGLRDRLRGTYGASKDPHAISSRFVRSMKSANVLFGMGGAMISSIPDIARIVMVEGFERAYKKGFKVHFGRQSQIINRMSKSELNKSAVAADAVLGLRASAFADIGDIFGNRTTLERVLNSSTGIMFMLNGLNAYNQIMKEFSGTVTMLRMTESIMKPWGRLSKGDKQKLLKNGIGQQEHMRMQQQIRQHGERVDGEWMPNTEAWTDPTMRLSFRNALNQNVERIIITPGAGDRALWTSTEFGSLITQFKSYGQSATSRMLISGLQERDAAFWQGAFLLVGLGALVNELKRKQYGIDKKETFDEKLINAIDRSGITGFFMDVNNAVEKLSNNRLGLRPTVSNPPQYNLPVGAKLNAVLGPTAGTLSNAASVFTDIVTGEADQKTKDTARFLTPFGNHPVADPFFDWAYGQ